ncbi:hypothetical protein [Nesterenkonia jeotgali]|uniref:Uncharacterized protein n=1 Tax=Nesterenkonia jeotgali TaxID=317018 RepID=A0A0W8IGA4_9MICC|nr:hypothetical protein [Nesterenkonia jeotgali]KUG58996.1 hypothetical protein AVL63_02945 [Nesterenkonia jeotgali]
MQTPEERRDDAVAAVIAAGGVVRGSQPMADPEDRHTVVAYRVLAGSPSARVRDAVEAVRAETETSLTGLLPWAPEYVEEVDEDESSNA